jgi:hypothetical protein
MDSREHNWLRAAYHRQCFIYLCDCIGLASALVPRYVHHADRGEDRRAQGKVPD